MITIPIWLFYIILVYTLPTVVFAFVLMWHANIAMEEERFNDKNRT